MTSSQNIDQEMDDLDDTLTNLAKPLSDATITVRVIKSFEYRTAKSLVLHHVDLAQTSVAELKQQAVQGSSSLIEILTFSDKYL